MKIIEGKTGLWNIVIGLEVHAQVISGIKLFSCAPTEHNAAYMEGGFVKSPNSMVSFFDAAMPGTLPVLNIDAVKKAVVAGLALGARINLVSEFERKNYFYPDLPHGYQITQLREPIVVGGYVNIDVGNGQKKKVRINHIHLEQDAGKSIHDISDEYTYIDLNRAGIALMEIVSEADLESAEEAAEYVKNLRQILRYVDSSTGSMEKGELRCDANVSVKRVGESKLGTRCEIKNLNSIKSIVDAINYEARYQVELLESGKNVVQQTKLFDVASGFTKTMRNKEGADDYRYFPDPDLYPLTITQSYVDEISQGLPELPDAKMHRYINDFGISTYDAEVITSEKSIAQYFDDVVKQCDPKMAVRWLTTELFGRLNKENLIFSNSPVDANSMIELLKLIASGTISERIAKQVFDIMFLEKKSPEKIVSDLGLVQISDEGSLEAIIDKVLSENEQKVVEYKQGKDKLFGFFVGEVMKLTQGKANPKLVNEILKRKLI